MPEIRKHKARNINELDTWGQPWDCPKTHYVTLGRNLNRDCPRAVLGLRSELGFTLIEILLVCAIIVILVSVGSASYLEAQRRAEEHRCAGRLQELALYEKMYAREFGDYALFWELQDQGYIDPHYIESDTPKHNTGIAFIPQYRLEFTVPGDGTYRIAASSDLTDPAQFHPRWRLTGGIWDLRAMYVDDRGIVRWVENNAPVYR